MTSKRKPTAKTNQRTRAARAEIAEVMHAVNAKSPATRMMDALERPTMRGPSLVKPLAGAKRKNSRPAGPMILQVWGSGATGVLRDSGAHVVHVNDYAEVAAAMPHAAGIVLTGGGDVNPARYGERASRNNYGVNLERDALEFDLVRWALRLHVPMFGICRGNQLINVALGGTLEQDLPSIGSHGHGNGIHAVDIDPKSRLGRTVGSFLPEVTTLHHQAVKRPGRGMRAVGWAADGTIEATESTGRTPITGVQFHPEIDANDPKGEGAYAYELFGAFIETTKGR